jgi:hypothetical protein
MSTARMFHTSTYIPEKNSVLIAGGYNGGSSDLSSTETFFLSNYSFIQQTNMTQVRASSTADRLSARVVLIAGGNNGAPGTAELFDLLQGKPMEIINMSTPRSYHASSVIDDGRRVLLAGGAYGGISLATGDVYDNVTNKFTPVNNTMSVARYYHTATAILNGLVIIAGGYNDSGAITVFDTLELYDINVNLFSIVNVTMTMKRYGHTATYISATQSILFLGGSSYAAAPSTNTYDLFSISSMTFTIRNGTMLNARKYHTATVLLNGHILIVGGQSVLGNIPMCEIYNPLLNTFTAAANLSIGRSLHTATLLANSSASQVLICGGYGPSVAALSTCELYQPA